MPTTIVIESYKEFCARHGNEPQHIGNLILFEDGAWCGAENPDHRSEPSENRYELLQYRKQYVNEWLRRCIEGFNRCKADGQRFPSKEMLNELKRLQGMVVKARADWEAIDKEMQEIVDASEEGKRKKILADAQRQVVNEQNSFRMEIANVNV